MLKRFQSHFKVILLQVCAKLHKLRCFYLNRYLIRWKQNNLSSTGYSNTNIKGMPDQKTDHEITLLFCIIEEKWRVRIAEKCMPTLNVSCMLIIEHLST